MIPDDILPPEEEINTDELIETESEGVYESG